MKIIEKNISELIPYEKNPRKNDEAVEYVAESIKQFGFKVPIVIDSNNVVVTGHTRLKASKKLKLKKIPCIIAEDLTEEQIKAFRLADNKVSEVSRWDVSLLHEEMLDIVDLDMCDFGFELFTEDDLDERHEEFKERTQERIENLLNLGIAQYDGIGKYDIPQINPVQLEDIGKIDEWIGFNYVLSDENPENKAVHFFLSDYQFERIWNNPDKYIEKLKQYKCVLSPDFSPYADMPMATQIYNHYRKHWIGRYMQENGVVVVPTIRASADKRSYEWCFDGEPKNGVVCISSMWDDKNEPEEERMSFINLMKQKLTPKHVFIYGREIDCYKDKNVTYIKNFTDSRWG